MVYRYFVTNANFSTEDVSATPVSVHKYSPKMFERSIGEYVYGYINYSSQLSKDVAEEHGLRAIA